VTTKSRVIGAVTIGCALCVGVATLGMSVSASPLRVRAAVGRAGTNDRSRSLTLRQTETLVRRRYGVFRRAAHSAAATSPEPTIPTPLQTDLESPSGPAAAPDLALATYLLSGTGDEVWAAPGAHGIVCEIIVGAAPAPTGASWSCHDASANELSVLDYATPSGNVQITFGMVPNGVASVQLTLADGSSESVPVANNFWSLGGGTVLSGQFTPTGSSASQSVVVP
jgi:hypothetical protein